MTGLWILLFWSIVLLIAYTYAGYPLTVSLVGRLLNRRVDRRPLFPTVTVIIAAYDEAEGIEAKIRNVLDSAYPGDLLEVVIASDGSTDGTVERARSSGSTAVKVLDLGRNGKAAALAEGVAHATGDVVVMSDANTMFEPEAVAMLAFNFADPEVGGVVGHTRYVVEEDADSTGHGEHLYWRYDTRLKELETLTGSVVSAHGGMYAVRRELFRPVEDPAVTDDFAISTAVVDQGRRLVFEPRAVGTEHTMPKGEKEFGRRVRLMTRGVRGVLLRRRLLNPFRHGFYSVALFSRKVLRRVLPLAFPLLLLASLALADRHVIYAAAAAAQLLLLLLAAIGWLLRGVPLGRAKALYVPLFFCLANLASVVAIWNVARGSRIERWTPHRHASPTGETSGAEGLSHVRAG